MYESVEIINALKDLRNHHAIERYIEYCNIDKKVYFIKIRKDKVISADDRSYRIAHVKVSNLIRKYLYTKSGNLNKNVVISLSDSGYVVTTENRNRFRDIILIHTPYAVYWY